ncbi:MAG: phytoene desaturase family protein [Verrucomicrobiota bacterium]
MAGNAIVIGGGLGGLSAAIYLAHAGVRVRLLEKNADLGGKCNYRHWQGYHFDTGPSLLTMPFVVDELFKAVGKRREDYLDFMRVSPACRYFFPDGTMFDAPGTLEGFRENIAAAFPEDLDGYDRFIDYGKKLWEVSGPLFLFNRLEPSLITKIRPQHAWAGLAAMRPWTMRKAIEHYFKAPQLRQLFSRYATYNGSDPWRTPATFNVISYVEMAFGSWHIQGGIYQLVRALTQLAEELGVEFSTGVAVDCIEFSKDGRSVTGVRMPDAKKIEADTVVVNADGVGALTGPLMAEHPSSDEWQSKWKAKEAASSGFVQLMAVAGEHDALACHNIFFNQNYEDEFTDLFHDPKPLRDPTIYISAPCKIDSSQAPDGNEAWFVLLNAPSTDRVPDWPADYGGRIIQRLSRRLPSFDPSKILWSSELPPTFLRDQYAAWNGSIYGPSSNTQTAAFLRLPNGGSVKGLYFAGGSSHPGGGIPLVLTSGRLAAELACKRR